MNKYVFPPSFDFLLHASVKPIAFYAFEFSLDLTQKDLMDIWQNCAPGISSTFKKSTALIQITDLVDQMLGATNERGQTLQWMVFKVKRRAEKDYNVFTRKGLAEGLPIVQPVLDTKYSYNWPYDYFSFVELIKIDETIVYATEDIIPEDEEGIPVLPDLREFIPAPEEIPPAAAPPPEIVASAVVGMPSPRPPRRRRRPTASAGRPRRRSTTSRSVPRPTTRTRTRPLRSSPPRPTRRRARTNRSRRNRAQTRQRTVRQVLQRIFDPLGLFSGRPRRPRRRRRRRR